MGSAEVIGAAGGTGEFLCRRHNGQAANLEDAGGIGVVPHPPRKPLFLRPDAPRP